MNGHVRTRLLVRGVIADVRAAVPGVIREQIDLKLLDHFGPAAADPITWELDLAFGPPDGTEG